MSFTVYDDGDLGLRYRVTDYRRGTLPFNGDVPRPSDTTLAIFFPNELIPVKEPTIPSTSGGFDPCVSIQRVSPLSTRIGL
jgi:hypothetical protein